VLRLQSKPSKSTQQQLKDCSPNNNNNNNNKMVFDVFNRNLYNATASLSKSKRKCAVTKSKSKSKKTVTKKSSQLILSCYQQANRANIGGQEGSEATLGSPSLTSDYYHSGVDGSRLNVADKTG
jgi:hypothetical protein